MGKEAGFFGVRISKALAEGAGPEKAAVGYPPPPSEGQAQQDELLRHAFEQGVQYATQELAQQRQQEAHKEQMASADATNDDKQRALTAAIDALHAREYRPPMQPMGCKEEREAVLQCYRALSGAPAGELVAQCDQAVRSLDKCANAARQAAMGKVDSCALPS